jgi:hypothetical protein
MASNPEGSFAFAVRRAAPFVVSLLIVGLAVVVAFAYPAPRGGGCPHAPCITGASCCDAARPFMSPFRGFVLASGGLIALVVILHTISVRRDPSRSLWSTHS